MNNADSQNDSRLSSGSCDRLRVVYAGTPEFAVPGLQHLIDAGHSVVGVYTQPDRPAGRGRKLTASAVKQCALTHGIKVFQPINFKEQEAIDELAGLKPDVMVVAAYGLILPADVLAIPVLGCLNIHASLLPRWRGAAPLQRSILAGDEETGVTIMLMDKGLDTGAMLGSARVSIENNMNCTALHDVLADLGAVTLLDLLPQWCKGSIEAIAQPQSEAVSYAEKLSKSEAEMDWQQSALSCHRKIMAFNPWPVAETLYEGQRLRLWNSRVVTSTQLLGAGISDEDEAGRVVRASGSDLWVQTGEGVLALESVQMPGKKAVDVAQFLGSRDLQDTRFRQQSSKQSNQQSDKSQNDQSQTVDSRER